MVDVKVDVNHNDDERSHRNYAKIGNVRANMYDVQMSDMFGLMEVRINGESLDNGTQSDKEEMSAAIEDSKFTSNRLKTPVTRAMGQVVSRSRI